MKFPTFSQWKQVFKVLTGKEKILFSVLLVLFLSSLIFVLSSLYLNNTIVVADKGGSFAEGVVGYPRFINPLYSDISDVDKDIAQILFSGLMKYDNNGDLVPELAQGYKILEGGKAFEVTLKENLSWQDGDALTANDVLFTIETIQNPDYKSPLRASWVGVTVKKVSESVLRFELRESSVVFLENLTLKILPSHVWSKIEPEQFPLSIYNLNPIGSGPYKLQDIKQNRSGYITAITMVENEYYAGEKPKIKKFTFKFYNSEEELIKAAKRNEIQGFSLMHPDNFKLFNKSNLTTHTFPLSRYFAIFLNTEDTDILFDKEIRQALNYGTDRESIIQKALGQYAKPVISPVMPNFFELADPEIKYEFNLDKAKELLDKAGFIETQKDCAETDNKDGNCQEIIREKTIKRDTISQFKSDLKLGSRGAEVRELQRCLAIEPAGGSDVYPEGKVTGSFDKATENAVIKFQEKYAKDILEPGGFKEGTGMVSKNTREELNELCDLSTQNKIPLKITLTTVDYSTLTKIAGLLKEQWAKLGIELTIEVFDIQTIEKDIIKNRNYKALLFGEVLSATPDPLPFWHSLQKKDPGSNLSLYENKTADKILEEIRQSFDKQERARNLEALQNTILKDAPAIFLYSQDYPYLTANNIKGIEEMLLTDPSKRFSNVTSWYIATKRTWKNDETQ
ncbi:MAG: hypothetical protein US98_C0045G0003 [Parcubacteria group bacterium GW2011_GWC1_38_6]|nr:MAG: hypothetical protein US98_C0045G0003 [Parcubacteria group bacterium GW2011_GWC1_38_6]